MNYFVFIKHVFFFFMCFLDLLRMFALNVFIFIIVRFYFIFIFICCSLYFDFTDCSENIVNFIALTLSSEFSILQVLNN